MKDLTKQARNILKFCDDVYILETSEQLKIQRCTAMHKNQNSFKHLPAMAYILSLGMSDGYLNNKFAVLNNRIFNENLLVGRNICF